MTRTGIQKLGGAALLVILLVAGTLIYQKTLPPPTNGTEETATVTRGSLQEVVTAQGKLEPKEYVDVGVQVSGQLKKLHVEIGDAVKKGDLLAEIDPQSYESRVVGDEANLASLKAQLLQKKAQEELDRSQFERTQALYKTKAVSKSDLETKEAALKVTEATIKSFEAQIAQSEASLESDKISLGYTKIYAPMDGVVSNQVAREGQTLNANQTAPVVVQIADLKTMTVRAQVAEADVMRLKPDMEASFSPLGSLDRQWKGRVRQILPTPEVVNDVVLYDALIDVDNSDGQLMNGMSTQDFFVVAEATNALLLPLKALGKRLSQKDSEQGRAYQVLVQKDTSREEREVLVGVITRTQVEIRSGLAENEKVVIQRTAKSDPNRTPGTSNNATPHPPGAARL